MKRVKKMREKAQVKIKAKRAGTRLSRGHFNKKRENQMTPFQSHETRISFHDN